VGLLLPAIALFLLAPSMLRTCVEMLRFFLGRAAELDPLADRVTAGLVFRYLLRLALPILFIGLVAGVGASIAQTGFLFTTKPLAPDFSRVVPHFGKYFQRTLFSREGLFNLAKNIFKLLVIGAAAYALFLQPLVTLLSALLSRSPEAIDTGETLGRLANMQKTDLSMAFGYVASLAGKLLIASAVLLLALSVPDFMFQRWQFKETLKMTKQAAKEEMRQYEGDPQVRAHLRRRYRELLSRQQLRNVPNADVVVTNPTHYAVALEYDSSRMAGPMVTAKGEDALALEIRRIAEQSGVPIRQIPSLARALYKDVEVGDEIPSFYYTIVASLLKNVMSIEKKQRFARERRK
jgi:flagellar biosynthetic protein FlhB